MIAKQQSELAKILIIFIHHEVIATEHSN